MSGAKETPRQKMIGMMYLVLTALLAINVSADVLDAFSVVNEGLEITNQNVEKKIEDYYKTFEQAYNKDKEKVEQYWNQSLDIRKKTDEIINFIERDIKLALLMQNNGVSEEELLNPKSEEDAVIINPEEADINKNRRVFHKINFENITGKDKHDAVTSFMITQDNATVLRNKLEEYRQYIINTIDPDGTKNYASHVGLITDKEEVTKNGEIIDWQKKNFNHVVIPAAFSVINSIVAEVQTTEYDAISELYKSIGASDFKFSTLEAKVFPKTTYVLSGQDYEADVFIVASDNTRKFDAKYARGIKDFTKANQNSIQNVSSENGIVKIKVPATAIGEQSIAGVIEMKNPVTGEIEPYPFQTSYTVAPPSANAAPTKMNIIYRGLDNPIQISAPGFTNDQLVVDISKGNITKDNGQGLYIVNVKDTIADKTTITTSAMIDGKKVKLGTTEFKLKSVPRPTATIAGKFDGAIYRDKLLAADCIVPEMPDFEFEGYNYEILSYTLSYSISGNARVEPVNGSKFNDKVKKAIESSRRGDRLNFENIRAKGPDGKVVHLNSITLKVQ